MRVYLLQTYHHNTLYSGIIHADGRLQITNLDTHDFKNLEEGTERALELVEATNALNLIKAHLSWITSSEPGLEVVTNVKSLLAVMAETDLGKIVSREIGAVSSELMALKYFVATNPNPIEILQGEVPEHLMKRFSEFCKNSFERMQAHRQANLVR